MSRVLKFLRDEDGPTAVEYAVMLALIVGLCLTGIGFLGNEANGSFQESLTKMQAAFTGS